MVTEYHHSVDLVSWLDSTLWFTSEVRVDFQCLNEELLKANKEVVALCVENANLQQITKRMVKQL